MKKITASKLSTIPAPEKYLNGKAWINNFSTGNTAGCDIASVMFEPGARTHWHKHPTVQILLAEKGCGYIQTRGVERELMQPGDMVVIYPGEEHWHGAVPDQLFAHLAIQLEKDEGIISEVTNEEYFAINS
ncbi:cupin domain-containing protein [Mucilaginibacter sp. X5P1]|uniref:cupin domain-containing protein n=1 Tax=Mucilaginibacter sp. X5P1 TaxID=2723088 RepID=UPI00162106AF|nr:cupin domain-containing protein [Mucilaginibacter sp. X5P1]MBB6136617.1 quercetin dioxygenase-like cupin family protein [Mucilaginibacter sp. X5P1]